MNKGVIIGMLVVLTLAGIATASADVVKKEVACRNKEVKIESDLNSDYFCGTMQQYKDAKKTIKDAIISNKLSGEKDYGVVQLFVRGDNDSIDEIGSILAQKYNPQTKQFNGALFDSDVLYQMQIVADVLDKKGVTEIIEGNLGETLYKLYNP